MAKDKRSFFERLTGAVHIEDEDDIEVGPHKNSGANAQWTSTRLLMKSSSRP